MNAEHQTSDALAEGEAVRDWSSVAALNAGLQRLSSTSVLLVACDFDGTLAELVSDPAQARPRREALLALEMLARLPHTHVAIVSGRGLVDLASKLGPLPGVRLVGSHGSEFDADFAERFEPGLMELKAELLRELYTIAGGAHGFLVEPKPTGAALHYLQADAETIAQAKQALDRLLQRQTGLRLRDGKHVWELSVIETNKGSALELIRAQVGASAAVYLGDDLTDESAFAVLRGPDVSIKVGEGQSSAGLRLPDPESVARFLARLAEQRHARFSAAGFPPIQSLSLLSDLRTAALISAQAEVVWLCAPRLDSPAIFAALLGGPTAGRFSIGPADGATAISQRYLGASLVLETSFPGFRVLDYLDVSAGQPQQRAGRVDLVRLVEGRGRVLIEYAPRLVSGRQPTALERTAQGLRVVGAADGVELYAPGVAFEIVREGGHDLARAEISLDEQTLLLELSYGAAGSKRSVEAERRRRKESLDWWHRWSLGLRLPSRWREPVLRSALTLRGLCHGPSGAIAAAATTSLPEGIGGVRNWDYRFCWPRDASLAAASLARLGSLAEGLALLDWLMQIIEELPSADRLRPIYLLSGQELWPEAEIAELVGYAGSRPVRVGNAAAGQVQLDVFGPIVDLVYVLAEQGAPLSIRHWRLVRQLVEAVARRWQEPDQGIWELRCEPRQHVHSKVMCWLAVERGARLGALVFGQPQPQWYQLAEQIRAEVLTCGFNGSLGYFTDTFGGSDLDGALLSLATTGLVPPDDPRLRATVTAIEAQLLRGLTVQRYLYEDGLPGREGGFHLLTAWLGQAWARLGEWGRAEELLEGLIRLAGPTGLLSEQYDGQLGLALGNHPQAYSHLGLIDLALELDGRSG
jgi:trehalose 6-phosphate phosphatase